jgi:CRP-like cAMP-binding protein
LNRQAILHGPTHDYGVALQDGEVLFWNELQWARIMRERPEMAAAIMETVLQQEASDAKLVQSASAKVREQEAFDFGRSTSGTPASLDFNVVEPH